MISFSTYIFFWASTFIFYWVFEVVQNYHLLSRIDLAAFCLSWFNVFFREILEEKIKKLKHCCVAFVLFVWFFVFVFLYFLSVAVVFTNPNFLRCSFFYSSSKKSTVKLSSIKNRNSFLIEASPIRNTAISQRWQFYVK